MNNRIEIAREFANTIKSDYIKLIIMFSSVARGDDTVKSNIYILIISHHHMEIDDKIADAIA